MKKGQIFWAIVVTASLLLQLGAKAQVSINVQILPPYPTKITYYASHPQLMLITLVNTSTTQQRLQLRGSVTGDNGIEIRAKQDYKKRNPLVLNPGESRSLNGNDLADFFDYSQLSYTGITQADFISKNGLPEGAYQFCVRAYDYDTNAPLSAEEPLGCSNTFTISSLEPPVILSPMDQDSISASNGQIFIIRWNTPGTTPPMIRYRIRMVEILGNRNPNNAIMSATQPYFFEKEVIGNSYIYNPADPSLTPGRRYALLVEAFDPLGQTPFRNNGRSEVISFTYKAPAAIAPVIAAGNISGDHTVATQTLAHQPECSCQVALPEATANANSAIVPGSPVKVNNFDMKIVSVSTEPDGSLSGTGTVAMPFISAMPGASLRVNYSGLTVVQNESKNGFVMTGGAVEGIVSGNAAGFMPPADDPLSLSPEKLEGLGNYLKTATDHLLTNVKNSASAAGFELPLSLNTGPVNVGIMRMHFTAKQAWFDAAAAVDIPDGNTIIGLAGKDICMNSKNLCEQGQLYLYSDLAINVLNLTLKKHDDNDAASGTSIAFDQQGFQSLHIDAEYQFPANTLLNASDGATAKLSIKADTQNGWDDWVAYATVDPFHINGVADFKFMMSDNPTEAQKLVYDHSSIRNAANMPDHIDSGDGQSINTGSPAWEGLFIPELRVQLPSAIKGKDKQPLVVSASNMIFQGGFTGYVHTLAAPLKLDEGSLGGWFFSVDDIRISFFKNSMTSGSMTGRFMLPASGKNTANTRNQLSYNCNLTSSGGGLNYSFTVGTATDLDFSALWAKVNIEGGSSISITGGGDKDFKITALLNGSMVIQPDIKNLPDLSLGYLTFQSMKFSNVEGFSPGHFGIGLGAPPAMGAVFSDGTVYGMVPTGGPNVNNATATGVMPEDAGVNQSLMGFDFSVDGVEPAVQDGKLGITFQTRMQLVNGVNWIPKAKLGFSIFANTTAGSDGHTWWEPAGGDINTIELQEDADLAGMKLKGFIKYFHTEADRGFAGALQVVLPGFGTNIGMKGLFGSRKQGSSSFQYFYIDAMFDLGNAGIMMFPGTALYGFSGGAYYNMERQPPPSIFSKPNSAMPDGNDPQYVVMESFSGVQYVPKSADGPTFGFTAGVYFGLQSRNIFEGELTLGMEFNNGSLNVISLDGRGDVLNNGAATFEDRYSKALGQVEVHLDIKFRNNHFWKMQLSDKLTLKYPPVKPLFSASGGTEFYLENMAESDEQSAQNVRWYFKAGVPWDAPAGKPLDLQLDLKVFKLGAKAYFECGNYSIDNVPGLPPTITNILNQAKNENNGGGIDNNDPREIVSRRENSTSGMIMGAMLEFDAHPRFAIFYADLKAGLGADFGLKFYNRGKGETPCSTSSASWYATGKAFVGAQASCGVHVNIFGIKKDIEFVKAGVAAVIDAGAPSPMYAQGTLGGSFAVLDGLVKGRFSINFTVGEVCNESNDSDQLSLIALLNPGTDDGGDNSILTRPAVSFNFPLSSDFVVPLVNNKTHETTYTLFRFTKDFVTTDITGGGQHFTTSDLVDQWGQKNLNSRGLGQPVYSLSLTTAAPTLLPLTTYDFTVKARVKKYAMSGLINNKSVLEGLQNKLNENAFSWVMDGKKIYEDKKTVSFKTDQGPKNIPVDNVAELLPYYRHQGLPTNALAAINNGMGYIKLLQPMDANSFNLKVSGPQPYIRFVKAEQGNATVTEVPVQIADGGKTWQFAMPHLDPSSVYALKLFFRGDAQDQPSAATTQLVARSAYARLAYQVSDRDLVVSALAMKANEQELFAWYFKTGAASTYPDKYNAMQLISLEVNGAKADINTGAAINLQNFDWAPNEATKTINTFGLEYQFKATEPFNTLDVNDIVRNKILPPSPQFNNYKSWRNMLDRAGLSPYADHITELDELVKQFTLVAFGPGKQLNIVLPNTGWNVVTGGLHTSSSVEFPHTTGLLPGNLYDINFSGNNYGQPPSNPAGQQNANTPAAASPAGRLIQELSSGNFKGQINIASGNYVNAVFNQPDYILHLATSYQSGEGLLDASNAIIKNIIQEKKNLGYPGDIFSELPGFGSAFDSMSSSQAGTTLTIGGPTGLAAPKVQVVAPQIHQQR